MKYARKNYRYALGGNLSALLDLAPMAGSSIGGIVQAAGTQQDGTQNLLASGVSGVLSGAGAGAALGPIGALAGGVLGGVGMVLSASKRNKALKEQKRKETAFRKQMKLDQDRAILKTFPTEGIEGTDFYAYGGLMKYMQGGALPKYLEGGEMNQIAPGVQEADGATHEEGGITVPDSQGNPMAEIEDDEVVKDGELVFSDNLKLPNGKTFAATAKMIAETPEYKESAMKRQKAQDKLADPKLAFHMKNGAERTLEKNPDMLEMLFAMQEQMKQAMQAQAQNNQPPSMPEQGEQMPESGLPIARDGLDLSMYDQNKQLMQGLGRALPYASNITNAILTAKTPAIPTPEYTEAPRLKTNYNINASLAGMERAGFARNKNLLANVNQSNIARANLLAGEAQDTYARNQLFQQKENVETELKNKQAMIEYQNRLGNNQKLDKFNQMKMMRQDDIAGRISANVAQASQTGQMQIAEENQMRLDKQRMALMMMKYLETGVLERSGFDKVMQALDGGASVSEAMKILQQQKQLQDDEYANSKNPFKNTTSLFYGFN